VTYERLFAKGMIGALETKNRVVMAPMGTMLANADGDVTDHHIRYFEERAKGGVGLIITEVTMVDNELGKVGATHPRADDDRFIPMLSLLADAVHKYDTKIFMQLNHAGRQGNPRFTQGRQSVAPSAIAARGAEEKPRVLTVPEIKDLVGKFQRAAWRCKWAGIDGVELHGAHGYLLNQFISPYMNTRDDEYGGSFENRMKFIGEIVHAIKKSCGHDFPVSMRISADEFVDGGVTLELGKKISQYLEKAGVDVLHISAGTYESSPKMIEPVYYPQGWRVYLAKAIKQVVKIPVVAVGVIREPQFAENVLKAGDADFVALGRGLLADPEWVNKAREGREKEIRKCISCNHCIQAITGGRHVACAVNARAGRELEFSSLPAADQNDKVVVIGGGPAGMEAARVLALRGYQVVLIEKQGQLGGKLSVASKGRGKEKNLWVGDYLSHELKRLKVDVRLNTEASIEELEEENPYAVVLATGTSPLVPQITGLDGSGAIDSEDILLGRKTIEKARVAVIGGGSTGCETAELLAANGNRVTLIELLPQIALDIETTTRIELLERLAQSRVTILTSHKVVKVEGSTLFVERVDTGQESEMLFDSIVVALGTKSNDELAVPLMGRFGRVGVIGDAKRPRKIADAIKEGFSQASVM
jgi:2,4-dienoyl-CoA reductase-like NADH-dependent reductase (Old Yellow Enzyme family)/thioredoxin reductase